MNSTAQQPAPPEIEAQIRSLEHAGLEDDRRQCLWSENDRLIAVVPIDLDQDGRTDYLAYPAFHLPTFCGAHSIACWVFRARSDANYDLVLSGRHDAVRIATHRTNGLRDIDLVYWSAAEEVTEYRYDGRRYRQVRRK